MKRLIARVGPCTLAPNPGDPFTMLVRCVISQQISTKAAASIFAKVAAAAGGGPSGTSVPAIPLAGLTKLTEAEFKACGVSGSKYRTIRGVIDHAARPDSLAGIAQRDDDAIREQLIAIKGIGPWTVEMFLVFGLGRPDVLSVGDYGIRVAVKNEFGLRTMPKPAGLVKRAKPWQPYRSIAMWYLWRSLDPVAEK